MSIAVVIVCPREMRDNASHWGNAGLVADSFWVATSDAEHVHFDEPNKLQALRIGPNGVHGSEPLVKSLFELGSLDEVRVAWIRASDEQVSDPLKAVEQLLREMLPPDQIRWLDIVTPTRRTDRTVVPLPGQWLQLRLIAEDRSAPDVTDAGWDLNLDVPLHGALVTAGILGGTYASLPWWRQTDAATRYDLRAFSRLVLGGRDTHAAVARFLGQTVPRGSAGTLFPKRFLELDRGPSIGLIDQALQYMLTTDSQALAYRVPETSTFAEPPRLSVWQHLSLVIRFLGYCIPLLFGIRPRTGTAHHKLNFTDAGHRVGEEVRLVTRRMRPADFDILDAQAAQQAQTVLDELQHNLHRDPPTPLTAVWRTLIRLATSLNDGGPSPDGWNPPEQHERRPVVGGVWTQPGRAAVVNAGAAELSGARSAQVAASAARDAAAQRTPSLAVLSDRTGAVATAQALAAEGNARDTARLAEQIDELGAPNESEPTGFLDRLAGRVIGARIRSRLDAERWSEFATGPSAPDPLDWNGAERRFRIRTLVGVAATAGLAGVWGVVAYFARGILPAWLSMPIEFIVIGVAGGGFLFATLYRFFKVYSAYMERGRRRLELRAIWLNRACAALRESARLAPNSRILDRWVDILGSIFPDRDRTVQPPQRTMPATAPKCMTVALPVYSDREVTKWLAEEGAEVGWRLRALESMAAAAFGQNPTDAIKLLVDDNGLRGGPLHDFWEQRDELWGDYERSLSLGANEKIAERMVASESRAVSAITPGPANRPDTTLVDFANEPWPSPEDDDQDQWDSNLEFEIRASRGTSEHHVHHNPDSCLLAVRLQLRRSGTPLPADVPDPDPGAEDVTEYG